MVDFRLLNGGPRFTVIERFDGSALLVGPGTARREFKSLAELKAVVHIEQLEISCEHLHASAARPKEESHEKSQVVSRGGAG